MIETLWNELLLSHDPPAWIYERINVNRDQRKKAFVSI